MKSRSGVIRETPFAVTPDSAALHPGYRCTGQSNLAEIAFADY
jgi:hypothetical protein